MSQTSENFVEKKLREAYRAGMSLEDYLKKVYLTFYVPARMANINNPGYKPSTRKTLYEELQQTLYNLNDPEFPCDKGFTPQPRQNKTITYADVANAIYDYRRQASYINPIDNDYSKLDDRLKDVSLLENLEKDGWIYRMPLNRRQMGWSSGDKAVERIVLNAKPSPEVIDILDDFCLRHKCYYKTPEPAKFFSRMDTVNIYSMAYFSENDKKELVQKLSPYIRKSLPERTNDLDGVKLADGIFIDREYAKDDLERHVVHLNSPFEVALRSISMTNGDFKVSLGKMTVFEHLTSAVNKYFPRYGQEWSQTLNEATKQLNVAYDTSTKQWVVSSHNKTMSVTDMNLIQKLGLIYPVVEKNEKGEVACIHFRDFSAQNKSIFKTILAHQQYSSQNQSQSQEINKTPQRNIYPAQYEDVVQMFDFYHDKKADVLLFLPKKKNYLQEAKRLNSIGLSVECVRDASTREIIGFKAPNNPTNYKIVMRLAEQKKRMDLVTQKENHHSNSGKGIELSVQNTLKIDAFVKLWNVKFNETTKQMEISLKDGSHPLKAYQAFKNMGLCTDAVIDKQTKRPKMFVADMNNKANTKIIQDIVVRLEQLKRQDNRLK